MKRIFCLVLTALMFLGSFSPKFCYAGGKSGKEEQNGITIIYVPQNRIHEMMEINERLIKDNLRRNFTPEQDILVKFGAVLFGLSSLSFGVVPKNSGTAKKILSRLLAGGCVLVSIGIFFRPNWIAYELDKANGSELSCLGRILRTEGRHKGLIYLLEELRMHQNGPTEQRQHDEFNPIPANDGIAIVTTPDGKFVVDWQKEVDGFRRSDRFPENLFEMRV